MTLLGYSNSGDKFRVDCVGTAGDADRYRQVAHAEAFREPGPSRTAGGHPTRLISSQRARFCLDHKAIDEVLS